jgi:hypothetical protein
MSTKNRLRAVGGPIRPLDRYFLSFFADFTYERSRSILWPLLDVLGATATIVGIVTGLGELLVSYGIQSSSVAISHPTTLA